LILSEKYKTRLKELAGILSEETIKINPPGDTTVDFSKSDERVKYNDELMLQAIKEGREVGVLYRGDKMKARSGKYRLIYPVALGTTTAGNKAVRVIHKTGQSETEAEKTGNRSAEAKNVWRLLKTKNILGMWFTGNYFQAPLSGYNPNDKGLVNIIVSANFNDIKRFQEELIAQQEREGERTSKITRFKERGERDLEQPIENPETRVSGEDFIEPSPPDDSED
jgi:mRNA-degrading endonuclease RelE of RelBE toxin-antitoxin system